MRRSILHIIILLLLSIHVNAQSPKREFRAAWIATVSNIDWPSKPGLTAIQQQEEFIARLNMLQKMGCNAVIVQVRPAADAFYPSGLEPWSRFLTGRQGQPPFPYYDPLKFMIEETHKRNMEFHAWFNPFRALTDSKKNPNPASHVTFKHPDWIIAYGGKSYIDPGMPQARDYVIRVIMDVVKRYDIDGVTFDDYFYPGVNFGDAHSYSRFSGGKTREDWRRNNVNDFISSVNNAIKNEKPYVKFGVSPFGIWRNSSKDPEGSATHGAQCYDEMYADILLWLRKGWIDYAMPQLYWEHHHRAAPFDVLLPWWESHSYNRHMYFALGLYRMLKPDAPAWTGTTELLSQIRDIRHIAEHPGESFYSASNFDKIYLPIKDSISKYYMYYALPPVMHWLDSIAPVAPVAKAIPSAQGTLLQWQMPAGHQKDAAHYAVYRFVNGEPVNIDRADKMIRLVQGSEVLDAEANRYRRCTYVVTALDRLWNESRPSNTISSSVDR